MPRRTRQQNEETVEIFHGINPETFEIERVYLTRGRMLHKHGKNMTTSTHAILQGREARTEIIVVWHLTDLISFTPAMNGSEFAKQQLAELKQKAEEKKEAAEQSKRSV